MEHSKTFERGFAKFCPQCGAGYSAAQQTCDKDNCVLESNKNNDPWLGTVVLNRYRLTTLLGFGSWGTVYKAQDQNVNREVAVKILHAHLAIDANQTKRFRREVEAASQIGHPGIATVYDYGTIGQFQPCLVLEYLHGTSMDVLLAKEGRMSVKRCLAIFADVCNALSAAHAKGIVHRDIKPANLMILDGDRIKIMDFGLARITSQTEDRLSSTGDVCGTLAYASPEQWKGEVIDLRADIYSLGCTLYEALSGSKVCSATAIYEAMIKHTQEDPAHFSEACPEIFIPPSIEDIVRKAIAKSPKDRFQTASEFESALYFARNYQGQQLARPAIGFTKNSALKNQAITAGGIIMLVLVVVAVAGLQSNIAVITEPKQQVVAETKATLSEHPVLKAGTVLPVTNSAIATKKIAPNAISKNALSQNAVSQNAVSQNAVSQNAVSQNAISQNAEQEPIVKPGAVQIGKEPVEKLSKSTQKKASASLKQKPLDEKAKVDHIPAPRPMPIAGAPGSTPIAAESTQHEIGHQLTSPSDLISGEDNLLDPTKDQSDSSHFISFAGKRGASDTDIINALKRLPPNTITKLDLSHTAAGTPTFEYLSKDVTSLRSLALDGCSLKDSDVSKFFNHIQTLSIVNCSNLTADGYAALAGLPNLEMLALGGSSVSDDCLSELCKGKLNTLALVRISNLSPNSFQKLAKMKGLVGLHIADCSLSPDDFKAMKAMPNLHVLWLAHIEAPPSLISDIAELPNLTYVSLAGRDIRDEDIKPLTKLPKLKILDLRGTNVSPDILATLLNMPHLRRVGLRSNLLGDEIKSALAKAGIKIMNGGGRSKWFVRYN